MESFSLGIFLSKSPVHFFTILSEINNHFYPTHSFSFSLLFYFDILGVCFLSIILTLWLDTWLIIFHFSINTWI